MEAEEKGTGRCAGIFDSHAHYFDPRFAAESEGADVILRRDVFGDGVIGVINVGTNAENSRQCIRQAAEYDGMYAAVGYHPEDGQLCPLTPEQAVAQIADLIDTPEKRKTGKIVAIGEIGLDYHVQPTQKERQAQFFRLQMELAQKLSLPVIVHDREAHGDCVDVVREFPGVCGVFHSYSGSAEMAQELVRCGWYVSFSGVVTFRNANRVRQVAQSIPDDRILLETDCPYLAPTPYRGRLNHSGLLYYTACALAEIRGVSYETIVSQTTRNAKDLFGIE